jgi:catechol 2,3-dioxygenase
MKKAPFSITRIGHVELLVPNLEKCRWFYVDLIGLVESEASPGELYLRGVEERWHHSLVLRQGQAPLAGHIAFKLSSAEDLDRAREYYEALGLRVQRMRAGQERGLGEAIRVQDPLGFPLELYYEMEEVERHLQKFHLHRGVAPARIDHVNVFYHDVEAAYDYYVRGLGFTLTEYVEDVDGSRWAIWLERKNNVHDIAVMTGEGPRLHHVAFWLYGALDVIRLCDLLASVDLQDSIERGPGRHGLSNALFLYVRDPAGHRVEFYTSDYLVADTDWRPIRWSIKDRRYTNFWGHRPPASFFQDATPVLSLESGEPVPTKRPKALSARPPFVH